MRDEPGEELKHNDDRNHGDHRESAGTEDEK
jgi:hypothetical protein